MSPKAHEHASIKISTQAKTNNNTRTINKVYFQVFTNLHGGGICHPPAGLWDQPRELLTFSYQGILLNRGQAIWSFEDCTTT
jgi:hypothetical protein